MRFFHHHLLLSAKTILSSDEDLFCSGEKASFGLSIGTPSEVLWETARAAPFSVCLLCSDADEESPYLQEACTYYGESRRATMVQKFECVRGEFLRGFSGANASAESSPLDSRLRCRFPEKGDRKKKDSTYQVKKNYCNIFSPFLCTWNFRFFVAAVAPTFKNI